MFGAMSATSVGELCFMDGIMNHKAYIDILRTYLQPSETKIGSGDNFIFMQDNHPKHTAHNTKMWLLYNVHKQLQTPSQSPDINPIEHLWDVLGRKIRSRVISNKRDLKTALVKEWDKISPAVI